MRKFHEKYFIQSIPYEHFKIKIITKDSKVSKRNMIKSLKIVKKFLRMLRIMLTGREKSI